MTVQRKRRPGAQRQMTVMGVFDDQHLAGAAVSELCKAGFEEKQIAVAHQSDHACIFPETGISAREARYYRNEWEAGRTVIAVASERRSREATAILRRHGSYDMTSGICSRTCAGSV